MLISLLDIIGAALQNSSLRIGLRDGGVWTGDRIFWVTLQLCSLGQGAHPLWSFVPPCR